MTVINHLWQCFMKKIILTPFGDVIFGSRQHNLVNNYNLSKIFLNSCLKSYSMRRNFETLQPVEP